jgi:hypothetical protein
MLRDHAVSTSRAISIDVGSPSEISAMFDSVSYSKVSIFKEPTITK